MILKSIVIVELITKGQGQTQLTAILHWLVSTVLDEQRKVHHSAFLHPTLDKQ